jgi:uncharacterized Zn finger protein
VKSRYPLDSLRSIRRRTVDEKLSELAAQLGRVKAAAALVESAQRVREASETTLRNGLDVERERLQSGAARALDLEGEDRWARAKAEEIETLDVRETDARENLRAEVSNEEQLKSALVLADADADAVDKHHDKWQKRLLVQAELAEEEAAAERPRGSTRLERNARGKP